MLDLLSPLRGYIAQSLQFYLSKYIEDIQLERLGLFGGDLVLNDLKIKRHVLRESLDIPSSFDFSRGFIRELRIHIPWTQLLSQPIEVKLYTIELILTAKNEHREQRAARGTTVMTADEATDEQEEERGEEERSKMEHPKSGWIHDTLQTILSNISVQVNNLVLKYEHDDIVFSIALGTLDFYSASASSGWTRSFDHLKREQRVICKSIDAKDVTIFLDRYMSAECGPTQDPVRRNVIGYEVPVLSRTSASVRAKLQLFPSTLSDGQNDRSGSPSFSRPAVHQQRHTASHDDTGSSMLDVGELCAHRPSVLCDPFYLYSHRRSCATPMYELDVFIGQLSFSVSDRQLEMLNQLVKSASAKMDQDHKLPTQRHSPEYVRSGSNKARRPSVPHVPVVSAGVASRGKKVHNLAKEQESWFGWAMNALGTAEDGKEEDELVSELLAETRRALLKVQPPSSHGNGNPSVANGPITKIFCVRLCISSVSMMLRKHDSMSHENEHQDFAAAESGEELVPVANLGMVRVIAQKTRRKVARPAMPILSMSLSYVALEVLLPCREEQDGMDLVLEIDKVELTSATFSENREDLQCRKGQVLLTCGSSDLVHSSDNVCHPYFTNSFFREEATRRNRREARSVEIVKVSLDAGVPAWKTLEPKGHLDGRLDLPCECSTTWDGESIHCVPIATLSRICQDAIRSIGIKERILDEGMLSNTVFSAWASHGSPISISEGLARSLVSIVEEYRIYRNPDVGALDNLAQLLQPQLISLFARYTLHTCSASSLYSSSDCTNTQHRSVHSALRLHLSSTSTSTDHKRSPVSGRTKEKATCRVLDVSIGAVHAMLEPVKCLEIAEALSIILRGNEAADIAKTTTADPESAKPVTPHAARSIESVLEKDVKLITVSSVCICLPDQSTEQKQGELDATSRDNLIVTARDFAWSETSHPGRNERHLHLGTLSIHLKRPSSQLTPMTLAEALGLDCSVTNSSADGDDNDCLCGNLNKLKVGFSTSAAQDVASMVNGISLHFGHSITWEAPIMTPKMLQTAFQIEVCRMEFSGAVSNRPRLVAAQLSAEVASISANLTRTGRTNEVVLQGGIAPMTVSKAELTTPLFKLEVMQENSSGALNDLPLCGPLALFSLNLGPLATTCLSCHLSTNAQLARMFADVQGVLQIVDAALDLVQRVKASLPPQQESDTRGQNSAHDAVKEDVVQSALADWSFKIDLKAAGGDIRVNEALRLKLPLLSVSSVEMDAGQLAQVKTGNALAIECTMKDIILSASESGVLKHMEDSKVLVIQGIHVSTAISRSLADGRLACAVDMTLCVSSIQASLSRLKLLYLLKYPTREVKAHSRNLLRHQVPELRKRDEPDIGSKEAAYIKWHWRLGAQLDHVSVSCTADISRQSARRDQATRVVVDGKIVNLAIAARVGNYHPIRNDVRPAVECGCFTDIQATVGDVQVLEKLQNARRGVHSAFGEFSRLHEPAFLGILVCLDLSDLQCLSESLSVSDSSIADQQSLPPAMLSWHLTSCLAKSFHEVCVEQLQREAQRKSIVAEIPLILSWKDSASMAHPFPLLSGFYRNYSEAGLPRYVFAGSMESVDAAVTTSSLYCLATLMDVGDKLASLPDLASRTSMGEVDDSGTRVPSVSDALPRISLANVEVSVWLGCIRLFLPSERLMDGIMLVRPVSGNAFVVLESLSVASAARNDISLDGLGYPPFNSRVLPRRATVQAQRFGQSQLRIGCRAGKITGYVAELKFGDFEMPAGKSHTEAGPFESHIGRMAGCVARFSDVETFWSPLNLICSLEEEPFVTGDGKDAGVKTVATLALTKWRLDLHKVVFDTLIARVLGVSQGISVLSRSLVIPARVAQLSTLQKHFPALERTHRRAVSFSCDGIEIQMFEPNRATHIRIGAVALVHDSSTLSGSASIQNLAVGYRANEGAPSSTHNDVAIEEVVFGANAEPSLWHLSVENYPEKLIAARWNFGDRSDRTLFLDVQAVQLHVSDHFVQESSRFTHSEPTFVFAKLYREEKSSEQLVLSRNNKSFAFRPRWSIKVLVAPSVISYCGRAHAEGRAAGIWIRSGQLFASAGVGNNDKTQQSILSYGQSVNEITRFVVVPTLEVMVNIDKLGVNTSDNLPRLEVHFQNTFAGPVPTHTSSTWQEFSKYISVVSEAQRLLHDCSVRITGGQHQMLERVAVGDIGVCLLYTDMVRVNVQAEVNALRVKISSFSLGAIHSLLRAPSVSDKQCDKHSYSSPGCTSAGHASGFTSSRNHALKSLQESSTDDFKMLRRVAVGRRPSPGELVFMESLMIETTSVVSTDTSPTAGANVQIQLDPNKFGIKLADTVAYIEDCNEPWIVEEHELGSEPSLCTGMGNKTHSWVGMRWCYHIPRKVHKIVANAVPHPPTGVLKGWPVWSWDQRQDRDADRLCDILCQLRCWDSKRTCYAVVCEFYVPWEAASATTGSDRSDDASEPETFIELMNQWFDDDVEKARYRSKLLEFGARTRTFSFDSNLPSDNWELRWRAPLQGEQELESKQKRLEINALLASSLQVYSVLTLDAYQRIVGTVTLPRTTLSVSHVGSENDSYDIVTAELNETVISCATAGSRHTRTLNVRLSSSMQAYLDNMAQLLTVSIIPRTAIEATVEISSKGVELTTRVGPVSIHLNQTTMLVLSAIPKLLQAKNEACEGRRVNPDNKLRNMRIKVVNCSGMGVWYRQEGTPECLFVAADTSAAYSWLSLASSPFYQICFAMDDTNEKVAETHNRENKEADGESETHTNLHWCDPCRIKDNVVTGRYVGARGFLWVCVELSGLQTIVTLRSSLTVQNHCNFPVLIKVDEETSAFHCRRLDKLCQESRIQSSVYHHPNCTSLDGSVCTLSGPAKTDDSMSRIMLQSMASIEVSIDGASWCSVPKQGNVPNEFDLVKSRDGRKDGLKKTQCSFVAVSSQNPDESTQYAWVHIDRAQCRTSLPTDFDPMQSQVSWRYTWMEVSLWPAISAENMLDFPVAISFAQKATFVELEIAPSTEKSLAIINPCEPVDVQLRYDPSSCSAQPVAESLMFCIANEDSSEHVTVFEGCKVVVSFCKDRHPMVRIRIERSLSIANMTPSILAINISSPPGDRRASEKIGSCAERSVGCRIVGTYLVISIATLQDLNNEAGSMNWSPEISLNVKGDAKPVVVPAVGPGPSSLVNAYCIEMVNRDGFLKLVIRPQVVMVNSTSCSLVCAPTDREGRIMNEDKPSLIPHNNHGWCVPVYLHKEEEKKGFTAGVSSWFSSKLSRHPGEDAVKASNQVLVTRISCSFRVSLVEDGYSWTEEISVMLPEASLLADPVGNLERVEARPLSTSSKNTDNLYPVPSTTTHRRRLLIRHRDFRHKMLTYTVTQNGKSIQVLFFDDHQPPVVIYNQCQRALGFRSVSFSSDPEGVGAAFYLEYDWDLQISQRRRKSTQKQAEDIPKRSDEDANELLSGWLRDSQSLESVPMSDSIKNDRMRFQIGLPQYGWSNALWQVGGIQFASFTNEKEGAVDTATPTFLVMCLYRAGSWVITITCLEDPTRDSHALGQAPSLISPAMASPATLQGIKPTSLRVSLVVEELSLRFCDEYDPVQDERGMIVYPEILRLTCDAVSAVFATAPDPPEVSLHSARLGYLSHIRSYTTVFVAIGDIEVGHSLNTCNFPLILCFQKTHESKKLLQLDLVGNLLGKQLPGKENVSLLARVIYVDTWDPVNVPSYFHTVELKLSPAVLQVEDDILSYMNAFIRPMLDAFGGEAASGMIGKCGTRDCETSHDDVWSLYAYESAMISTQRKVYIEHLEISNIDVIITARVSIPVLNSFDGTPLHFGSTKLRDVFSFPDQLYKDLAADYVADTIVRSPLLLMSLNIIGNPAGFVRSFGQGVRNLVEIPLAASKKGYNPWLLTKGVVGGVASFLGHATVATLTSVSGFSYSISRTVDQLTLPVDQLRKRHYIRPTHLSSALAEGLGALGSSVVGAAAGVVTTPIAVYKERQRQGLDTGLRNVVGGVGMGLVGIVARPMGGVASLVSMASDGLLYGINSNQTPFSDSASRVGAQPNELLRYKLKVLPDEVGSNLVFAHGIWVVSDENQLTVSGQSLDFISSGHLDAPENESLCSLLLPCDKSRRLVQVTLVCSNICVYVVGVSGAHYDAVLVRTLLESIKAVEESLTEPTVFDLGIKTLASAEWLRFRLLPRQRRLLSHQLRLWMDEDSVL